MGLFDMGTAEILLILVVALVIWGPGKIIEIGRTLGKMMRVVKKASLDLTTQVTKELEQEEKEHSPQSKKKQKEK